MRIALVRRYYDTFPNKAMPVQNLIFTNRIASQELGAGLSKINGYKLVDMLLMPLEYHSR